MGCVPLANRKTGPAYALYAEANEIDVGLVAAGGVTTSGNAVSLRILFNHLVDNAIRYA